MAKLDFIIIGGQKCGSTYLHTVIDQHPAVNMVEGECSHLETPDYENGGITKLEELLNELNQEKKIGIKRPNYLSKPEVKGRIAKMGSDVKLIVILRNPIERLKSAYFHQMNDGFAPILPLNEGVDKLLKGELAHKYPRTDELVEFGYYAKYLKEYMKEYRDNLLILFHDDLKKDKMGTIRKCYAFLGVEEDFIPDDRYLNSRPQKVNYSLTSVKLLTKKNKYLYHYNKERTRLFVKEQNAFDKLMCKSINRINKYITSSYISSDKKPSFSPEIHRQLVTIYKDDIREIESMCGVSLSNWTEPNS